MPVPLIAGESPIAGYPLVRPLGQGGFGEVWEALAPGGVRVALKFIRLDTHQAAPEQRALEVIRDIRHPHLLDVQFAVRVEDYLVIAMPLCDQSLKDRLDDCQVAGRPGIPRDELIGYMEELAGAVDFLNEARHPSTDGRLVGVQHRDIKPHNVFLVGGSARLADFGLAKVLEASRADHTGHLSPRYAAPEMIEGQISNWTDQYSLACSYVHLRTGRPPFEGESLSQILYAQVHRAPHLSSLPEPERAVVARALAKRPAERWSDCREFVQSLRSAIRLEPDRLIGSEVTEPIFDDSTDIDPAPTTIGPLVASRSRGPRVAAMVALMLGLAGLVGWLVIASHPAPSPKLEVASSPPIPTTPPELLAPKTVPPEPPRTPVPPVKETVPVASPVEMIVVADSELAARAHGLLKKYCHGCHGVKFEKPPLDVLDRAVLVAMPPALGKRTQPYVVPGRPDDSTLWHRVGVEADMPPDDPSPSLEEKAVLKRWIEAGAPFPDSSDRPFVAEREVLTAIRDHLDRSPEADRIHQRYFTLANLHNNRKVLDADLTLARAGLAKLVNSLSWKPRIVIPRAIDRHRTVYAIDVRDLGWDRIDAWRRLIRVDSAAAGSRYEGARDERRRGYPYGLTRRDDRDPEIRRLAEEIERFAGFGLPMVRADWFLATASRPPLYEEILELPENARDLERQLGVDVEDNFHRDRLARAGFGRSGVSNHNRMVERHDASKSGEDRGYWKSYDFKLDEGTGSLVRFPLGPTFAGNPFARQAFEHAGGEIIFALPNGLQGYLLVNDRDGRIEAGPIDVVGDSLRTSGTATIVNGLSCMACHKAGMIAGFTDEIRNGSGVAGEARVKVERIYPLKAEMDRLLAQDQDRFESALAKALGAILAEEGGPKSIRDLPEPIGVVARLYHRDLVIEDAAAELGDADPGPLLEAIRNNPGLRKLGLGPLLQPGGTIKRSAWESLQLFNTPFQDAARQLERGTPFHEL